MIFIFYRLSRITKLSLIIFIFCGVLSTRSGEDRPLYAQTVAKNQSFSKQLDIFIKSLIKASKDECIIIFGRYGNIIANEIDLNKLYFVSYNDLEYLLNQAVSESIDSLTLFSHPLLQDQKHFAIVFNEGLLTTINNNFDFHALFNISIPSLDDGPAVKMKFFVVGQGKIVIGYNRNAKIKHPDYGFATGNYDYKELFIMDAKIDSRGTPGVVNIKGISNPNEKPQWMKGPLNSDIHSMIITAGPTGRRQIITEYDLLGIRQKVLRPIMIEKLYNAKKPRKY